MHKDHLKFCWKFMKKKEPLETHIDPPSFFVGLQIHGMFLNRMF
jgi:hypothetical protein